MSDLSIFISLLAFGVSIAGFTISLLGYRRDRSKLRVWSRIFWQHNGPDPETPVMHVTIANVGRRPVAVLNLVMYAGRVKWWRSIQQPVLSNPVVNTHEQIQEFKRKSLAHLLAQKLAEGEILEMTFQPENCSDFISTHDDQWLQASRLEIEDVSGRLHAIKGSKENLAILFKAWRP